MPDEFKSFFKSVGGNEGNKCKYPHRLDSYGKGCQHDCSYCYAKSLLDFRKLWHPEEPAVADIEAIKKTINKIKKEGYIHTVRLGGMTDCFQPLERKYHVTYEVIKALNEARISYLIVTKSDIIADDEYINILDKDLAHIQITVTTTDDKLSQTYEKATLPSYRIKAIEKLQANGFDVALRLSPFIDEYIDYDILNNVKCDKIQVEFLRVNTWIEKWFHIDYSDYTVKQSGYRHLPLEKKKELIKKITGFKYVSVCEDESEAYEYWKNHFNPNPDDCCNLRPLTKNGETHINQPLPEKRKVAKSTEKKVFEMPEEIKPLYEKLHKALMNKNKDFTVEKTATYFKYMLSGDVILTVSATKKQLKVVLNNKKGTLDDSIYEDVSTKGKSGIGNYRVSLSDENDFKLVLNVI